MRITTYIRNLIFGTEAPITESVPAPPETDTGDTCGFSVGDAVVTPKGNVGSIRAIVDSEAWVKTGGKGQNVVVHCSLLDRPNL